MVIMDAAGYIVLFCGTLMMCTLFISIAMDIRFGLKSRQSHTWHLNTLRTYQILGVALVGSATTMPVPPMIVFVCAGIGCFMLGFYGKRKAPSRSH